MDNDRNGDPVGDWDWAAAIAGRVALCVIGVLAIGAVGVGFALGRLSVDLGWFG